MPLHAKPLRILALLCLAAVMSTAFRLSSSPETPLPMAVAHRGCWLMEGDAWYIPENCPAGVAMAARFGYPAIECDVKYTADSVMVLMHDETINRTMRTADGYLPVPKAVRVRDLTFEQLRSGYVLASTDPALRTPIPTLEELLLACREYGIVPMLHSALEASYRMAQDILGDGGWICFGGEQDVRKSRAFSRSLILVDPGRAPAAEAVGRLRQIGGACGISTMKYDMLDKAYIQTVKDAGFEVQASIFPAPHEQRALHDGVTVELSDFFWFQTEGRRPSQRFRQRHTTLSEGETLSWDSATQDSFVGATLDLVFEGEVEITFCGRTYTLRHDAPDRERFGTRLYKIPPTFTVKALSPVRIRSCLADIYAL